MPFQQRPIAGCPPGGMKSDEIEWRGIGCAVVRRMRDQLEVSKLSVANLVQDLARLCVTVVVLILCLEGAQEVEGATSEIWMDQNVLQRSDQAVPAKRSHIFKRLAIKAVELLVAASDREH